MGKGGEGRRREGRAGEGKFAPAPSKYIWIDAAGTQTYNPRHNDLQLTGKTYELQTWCTVYGWGTMTRITDMCGDLQAERSM